MATPRRADCGNCRKPIYRAVNDVWYHTRTQSTACYPGSGSWKRATAPEVPAA